MRVLLEPGHYVGIEPQRDRLLEWPIQAPVGGHNRVAFEVPMEIQRITARDEVAATRGQVALRYGPLVYSFERADQKAVGALNSKSKTTIAVMIQVGLSVMEPQP